MQVKRLKQQILHDLNRLLNWRKTEKIQKTLGKKQAGLEGMTVSGVLKFQTVKWNLINLKIIFFHCQELNI